MRATLWSRPSINAAYDGSDGSPGVADLAWYFASRSLRACAFPTGVCTAYELVITKNGSS